MKKPFSDQDLIVYSGEHLFHELKMFWLLAEVIPQTKPGFTLSALLDSFAIHLRNLIDFYFFCPPKKDNDDVVADDFFSASSGWSRNISDTLGKARERANKEISHLTTERKGGLRPDKEWDVAGLFKEIEAVSKNFAAHASTSKLHAKVGQLVNLSNDNVFVWLNENATYSNVAVQTVTFTSPCDPVSKKTD